MSELEEDIRATADAIAEDAERLAFIEAEKATLDSADPRMLELSALAEAVAKRLVPSTAAETELVVEANR